jgi:hypothetical protein
MENIDKKGGSSVLTHKKNREHLRQFMDRNDIYVRGKGALSFEK